MDILTLIQYLTVKLDRQQVYDLMYDLEYEMDGSSLLEEMALKDDKEVLNWVTQKIMHRLLDR